MQRIEYDNRDVEIYLELRSKVGWIELGKEQAKKALENSLKIVTIFEDNRPIAMGRIVGDGAVVCYIQDLIVIPQYQSKHLGSQIIEILIDYVKSLTFEGNRMMLCLMCAKGRESFYEKHSFTARPTDLLGPGMIQYVYYEG